MFPIESIQLKNYLLALYTTLLPLLEFANQSFIYLLLLLRVAQACCFNTLYEGFRYQSLMNQANPCNLAAGQVY